MEKTGLKIRIYKKVVTLEEEKNGKKVKRTFDAYFTKMRLIVVGEEEKGRQDKWVTVKFRKDVDTKDLKSGFLFCQQKDVNAPFRYEVKENEDGVKEYPELWVRGYDFFKPIEVKHSQDDFAVREDEETEEFNLSNE